VLFDFPCPARPIRHRMAVIGAAAIAALMALEARADGFAVHDLSQIADRTAAALGDGYIYRASPERLTLTCPQCEGGPMIDILVGRQNDGTEERVRSGATPISRLQEQCQAREPSCIVTALEVSPAVGWISQYPIGASEGSTAVIIRDGDLLTVRSLVSTPGLAVTVTRSVVDVISGDVIGD